jgi:hypothetical protein
MQNSWNKGEWSELYVLLRLLAAGRLYAGDADLNRMPDVFFVVLKILREEKNQGLEYVRNSEVKLVESDTNKTLHTFTFKELENKANKLLKEIKKGKGRSFAISTIDAFVEKLKCAHLKSKSSSKKDISIIAYDSKTSITSQLSFSIKSYLGGKSTLFNSDKSTNFVYEIKGASLSSDEIKKINNIKTGSKVRDRIRELENNGATLNFNEIKSKTFQLNLDLIDTKLSEILSSMILAYFRGQGPEISKLAEILKKNNPCKYDISFGHPFYEYKIKKLLVDIALGMTSSKKWTGHYDATGGYIVVKEDGDIVCYHIIRINDFEDYLFKNTKLDSPATTRHQYGTIYKKNDRLFFNLNLQIRFV